MKIKVVCTNLDLNLDVNFVKLYKLSQMIIEYLLHSQRYLLNEKQEYTLQYKEIKQNTDKLNDEKQKLKLEMDDLKKIIKGHKKTLFAYELLNKSKKQDREYHVY